MFFALITKKQRIFAKNHSNRKMRYLNSFLILTAALMIYSCSKCKDNKPTEVVESDYVSTAPTFNVDSAYEFIRKQCEFGPRVMNSQAHDKCGDYIVETFKKYGAEVYEQNVDLKLYDGTPIKNRNIIAAFNPDSPDRIIIASHWDSRPWADNDPNEENHKTPIDGANDGASGVGVMMELARLFAANPPKFGVDLICFDAEDAGTPQWESVDETESSWCIGSQYWAGKHHIDGYQAHYGILLDMVGGPNSVFRQEGFSVRMASQYVDRVWTAAQRLGYGNYFLNELGGFITDDHLQVCNSGIPCIDIIASDKDQGGFCKTWHTINDNIQNIDRNTLKAVGQTVTEVIFVDGI